MVHRRSSSTAIVGLCALSVSVHDCLGLAASDGQAPGPAVNGSEANTASSCDASVYVDTF